MSGPNSQVKQQLVPLTFDTALAGTSIGALSITDDVADGLLHSAGKTLQEVQDTLDSGAPSPGVQIPDVEADVGHRDERAEPLRNAVRDDPRLARHRNASSRR